MSKVLTTKVKCPYCLEDHPDNLYPVSENVYDCYTCGNDFEV